MLALSLIDERFSKIKRILVVASSKGGVGKSIIASTLALELAKKDTKQVCLTLIFMGSQIIRL